VRSQRKDAYYKQARAAGFRARSAYKLTELDRRYRLFRPGDHVADLGAWPGAWLQVALTAVGREGRVVGVDLVPLEPIGAPNVSTLAADLRAPGTAAAIVERLGRPADIVLSDLAPKLTGIRVTDDARCLEVALAALDALPTLLRPGGRLAMKAFMSPEYQAVLGRVRACFATVHTTRPEATRRGSAELYLVGLDHIPRV
jgi:23S rRNA (uridine2552-2'-O)-methyltransferase